MATHSGESHGQGSLESLVHETELGRTEGMRRRG